MTVTNKPISGSAIATIAEWREFARLLAPDGVDGDHGSSALQVSVNVNGTSVDVANGKATVQGTRVEVTAGPENRTTNANGGGSGRPDRLVLQRASATGAVTIVVKEGTAGAAAPPALTQSDTGTWEVPLARWVRAAGGGITNLVDERQFIGPSGTTVLNDAAITDAVKLTALIPNPRKGQRVLTLTSGKEYRWSGSFWERVDPEPLLDLSSTDGGAISNTAFVASLTGANQVTGQFVAPLSGRVIVTCAAWIDPEPGTTGYGTVRISGSGFDDFGAGRSPNSDEPKLIAHGQSSGSSTQEPALTSNRWTVSGLTPGTTYSATFYSAKSGSSTAWIDLRRIMIERA